MPEIYIKSVSPLYSLSDSETEKIAENLPFGESEIMRILSQKNKSRRLQSLSGLICLSKLIEKNEKKSSLYHISREEKGRPFFTDFNGLDFGITHSENIAAAVLLHTEGARIGIDIERVGDKKGIEKIAHRFFTEREQSRVFTENGEIVPESFFRVWTEKESAAKHDGRGLAAIAKKDMDTDVLVFNSFRIYSTNEIYILTLCTERSLEAKLSEVKFFYDEDIKSDEIKD